MKVKKVTVEYDDGTTQTAELDGQTVHCEQLKGGGIMNAGEMTLDQFAADLCGELNETRKLTEFTASEPDCGEEVCALLRDIFGILCYWEYPGYIGVPLSGGAFDLAIGNINETWCAQVHDCEGDTTEHEGFDTNIKSEGKDVNRIATVLAEMIREFRIDDAKAQQAPTKEQVAAVLDLFATAEKLAAGVEENDAAIDAQNAAFEAAEKIGWQWERSEFANWALKATSIEVIREGLRLFTKWGEASAKGGKYTL